MDLGMGLSPAASQCWGISMKSQKGRGVRGWYFSLSWLHGEGVES